MVTGRITQRSIVRVLFGGFALVILTLAAATLVSVGSVQSIRDAAGALVTEQLTSTRLIHEIQREQGALSAVVHKLAGDPASVDVPRTLAELESADQAIQRIVAAAAGTRDEARWGELADATAAFSSEARAFLNAQDHSQHLRGTLVQRHEAVLRVISQLTAAGSTRSATAEREIARQSSRLVQQSAGLLLAGILVALLTSLLTIRSTTALFRKMEWQAGELSRVSWQMLERQEDAARRFSHELHDELGQTLTALKANLLTVEDGARKQDSLRLVDEAVGNVRELSQLLRPLILDDFGLDAALRWLAEKFTSRTGIQVEYASRLECRLPEEAETHLFRIAQEALTNAARHSGARRVRMTLSNDGATVSLCIQDDGKGLPGGAAPVNGLGMVGMRARARSAGGELTVRSRPGEGVTVEADVPLAGTTHEQKDPDFVGR